MSETDNVLTRDAERRHDLVLSQSHDPERDIHEARRVMRESGLPLEAFRNALRTNV